jgi:hypothetical protein
LREGALFKRSYSPLIKGQIFQAPIAPLDINWPRETSRKNMGTPARKTARKYGMRKAPVERG